MPYDKQGHVTGTEAMRRAFDKRREALKRRKKNAPGASAPVRRDNYEPGKTATSPTPQKRDYQPYGVGKPTYGAVRSAPNVGPVSGKEGYAERDRIQSVYKQRAGDLLKRKKQARG